MTLTQHSEKIVFVLDDEASIRMMLEHVLTASGYRVEQFSNPLRLLKAIRQCPPHFLILDLSLDRSDAVEVIRQLEVIQFKGDVLLISGSVDPATLKDVKEIGLYHHLSMLPALRKPFRASELNAALKASPVSVDTNLKSAAQNVITLDVQDALMGNWLELWYQPKVDLKTMLVCGAEALARVNHPTHGVLSPLAFIPPANDERHQALARFVVRQAMWDWTSFANVGLPITLSINMPVSVIQSGEFLRFTRESLPKDSRFPGLIVEMTEDEMVRDFEAVREAATQLKLYGVSLSIDDFGTAHSSLSRLYDCPCAELKIDRKFVQNCATDKLKRSLCLTVIDLAHRIGARVCAEGVETTAELQCLLDLGCDIAQGFLFGRPMPAGTFEATVSQKILGLEFSSSSLRRTLA